MTSSRPRRGLPAALALLLLLLVLPSAASAQATRTWVSGVGDDANPCSRTAPCKTFAGAISKTAAGGEMNVLDPGGFGGVTITKSMTIRGRGPTAGVLVSGTNAIVINAGANDRVTLKGLDINGIGTGAQTSLSAIKVLSAKRVYVKNVDIHRFRVGVAVVPTSVGTRVLVSDSDIFDNRIGVFAAPGSAAGTGVVTTLRNNDIYDNLCGAAVTGYGANASTPDGTTACGSAGPGAFNLKTVLRVFHNGIYDNNTGIYSRGFSQVDLGDNEITGNDFAGLLRLSPSTHRSFGDNSFADNGPDSTAPSSVVTKG